MDWRDDIVGIADALRPRSLLAVMPENEPLWHQLAQLEATIACRRITAADVLARNLELKRSQLAIVASSLEHMDKRPAASIIARLRDLYSKALYAVVPLGPRWPALVSRWRNEDLIALGLRRWRQYSIEGRPLVLYHYDIFDYKLTPDWLNARRWANPERWDQERW